MRLTTLKMAIPVIVLGLSCNRESHHVQDATPLTSKRSIQPVLCVDVSPDGNLLATGGGRKLGEVIVWDLRRHNVNWHLKNYSSPVYSIAFSADNKLLVTGGAEVKIRPAMMPPESKGEVRVYDVVQQRMLAALYEGEERIQQVAIVSGGKELCAISVFSSITFWDVGSWKKPRRIGVDKWYNTIAAITPDGRHLVAANADWGRVFLWNVLEKRRILEYRRHNDFVSDLAVSSDGQMVVAGSRDKTAKVWNLVEGNLLCDFPMPEQVSSVALSKDKKYVAAGTDKGQVYIWETGRLAPPHVVLNAHEEGVGAVAFSPDSSLLVSGQCGERLGEVKVWELRGGRLKTVLKVE